MGIIYNICITLQQTSHAEGLMPAAASASSSPLSSSSDTGSSSLLPDSEASSPAIAMLPILRLAGNCCRIEHVQATVMLHGQEERY